MKSFSIFLGRPFGIPTTIHWTFWILIIWIIYVNASQGQGGIETLWYVLFVFAIFACVVLHELGHALAARRYGIQTRSITILPIGGVASLEKIPEKPGQELVVALAGPVVNVLIAIAVWILITFTRIQDLSMEQVEEMTHIHGGNFLLGLLSVNILLVVFNMIPAFPMDGGRVLRALLAMKMDRVKATDWAVTVGKFFAIIFVFWGFSANPFLIFIALFIFLSASAELEHVRSSSYLDTFTAKDVIMKDYSLLPATSPLSEAIRVLLDGQEEQFLVSDNNDIVGFLTKNDIIQGLSENDDSVPIHRVARPNVVWVTPSEPLLDIRNKMLGSGVSVMAVGKPGHLEGILDLNNINEFLLIRQAMNKG